MISLREIKRKLHECKTHYKNEEWEGKVNCYLCIECGKTTKTVHVDGGTIPAIFACNHCGGIARSTLYEDTAPDEEAVIEWYRPDVKELLKMRRKRMEKDLNHILNGGLTWRYKK